MFPKVRIYSMVCVIVSIVALALLDQSSAVEILDCGPGTPLVVEEAFTNIQVVCINIHQGFEVLWYLNWTEDNHSIHMKAVHCLRTVTCIGQLPYTGIYRTPYTTALNLTDFIRYFHLTAITCTERHPYTGNENSYTCTVRVISRPEISCRVHFSPDTGTGEGHCNVTNIHFRERQYLCIWYQLKMNSEERTKIAETSVTNYRDDGTHVRGTCTTIIPRPSSGQFIYEVLLLPEDLRVKATLSDTLTQK